MYDYFRSDPLRPNEIDELVMAIDKLDEENQRFAEAHPQYKALNERTIGAVKAFHDIIRDKLSFMKENQK